MPDIQQDGWNEWSKHVLKELQRLNNGQDSIRAELHELRNGLAKVSAIENDVIELKMWKRNVTEITSPTQLQELVKKVNDLESFKIKAIAIFGFVQLAMTVIIGLMAI